ncbi:NAD-dependent epimerase/dehydratase family protein [Streptomyces sp. NPDC047108]|uniref:NAD-dependent epimerase/dehydratase family protein n=1 Tax=Streptomyces sp. NPDC047108 TaxID=3155025 RepID=UPI0033ED7C5C
MNRHASTRDGGLRVVVVGATGNVGTGVVQALAADPAVESVVGIARRRPAWAPPKTTWAEADIGEGHDLVELFSGADAVVHLAWLFQPTHQPAMTWRTNVLGSVGVFEAVAEAHVPSLVYSSSVGAYSPGPKDQAVDESWPTHGWPQAAYCREKAYVERVLDAFELENPQVRVARMRPGFIFKEESATEQRRLFAGPFLPQSLVRPRLLPVVPDLPGLRFQVLHSRDAADAFRRAIIRRAQGAFNLASDPVVDAELLAEVLDARVVRLSAGPARTALAAAWRLHLLPASPDLFDAVLRLPVMDTSRARAELDWTPRHTAQEALADFLRGLRQGSGMETPPLARNRPRRRFQELATGVGQRP